MAGTRREGLTVLERRRLRRLILLLVAAGTIFLLFVPGRGLFSWLHGRRQVTALEKENRELARRNRELAAEIKRLQTDDAYLEELARKKYGLLREDETVYEFSSRSGKKK